jgi:hypothetical protein
MTIKYVLPLMLIPTMATAEVVDFSRTLTVKWDAPTARLDGAPLTEDELSKYELEHGDNAFDVPSTATSYDLIVSRTGEHCVRIRAVDTDGLVSPWSDQACIMIKAPPMKIRIWFDVGG